MSSQSKVLIVDDSELNAMMVAAILEAFSIENDIAPDGETAINMARNGEYAFILMDNLMPGLSGIETTEKIAAFSSVPIFGMTADLTEDIAEGFRRAGASGTLAKPLKRDELESVIAEYLPDRSRPEAVSAPAECSPEAPQITLRECLSDVKGLDYDTALANAMGSEKSFYKVLKATPSNIRNYIDILKEYIVEKDTPKLKLASHSLKSIFASLGIEELRATAAELEERANRFAQGNGEMLSDSDIDRIWWFVTRAANVVSQIEKAAEKYQAGLEAAKEQGEPEEVITLTAQQRTDVVALLNRALERFEIDNIMFGISTLRKAAEGEERRLLEEAEEAAGIFDYDRVSELLGQISRL